MSKSIKILQRKQKHGTENLVAELKQSAHRLFHCCANLLPYPTHFLLLISWPKRTVHTHTQYTHVSSLSDNQGLRRNYTNSMSDFTVRYLVRIITEYVLTGVVGGGSRWTADGVDRTNAAGARKREAGPTTGHHGWWTRLLLLQWLLRRLAVQLQITL